MFKDHERFLWGICYRLTGSAADAEDLVQETFARAMERPPARTDDPWRPWLVRVAMNLGRDWLPAPVETDDAFFPPLRWSPQESEKGPEARYELMESFSFAFLLALEALTAQQRTILLFRDVLDHSVRETAEALGISEGSVKTTHHRARRAMRDYDQNRCVPTRSLRTRTRWSGLRTACSVKTLREWKRC
jgi:RNA polymerase sigma-70 factor (ECF subfamily)